MGFIDMDFFNQLSDWTIFGIIFVTIFFVLGTAETIRNFTGKPPESTRKFVHIFIGLIICFCPILFKVNYQLITLSSLFIVINTYLLLSKKFESINATNRKSYGTIYFPFSVLILSFFWWDKPISFILAILVLTLADPIAAIFGSKQHHVFIPWIDKKSLRGTLAMFGSSFLIILLGTDILSKFYGSNFFIPFPILFGLTIFTALSATLAELVSFRGSDNLSIPIVTFVSYEIYLINYTHGTLSDLLLWTILSIIIFTFANKKESLSLSGAIGGYLLGIIIFGAGGWYWITPLVFFFISSSALSHIKRKEPSKRNILQILANGGFPTICAIGYIFWGSPHSSILYLGGIAAATADTWGTEIGYFSKSSPTLIFSKKKVSRGTSGGITYLGTLGSIFGGFIIGLIGQTFFGIENLIIPIAIAGLSGSLFDSMLGNFIQGKYLCNECNDIVEQRSHCNNLALLLSGSKLIDNNMVNFLNTLFGAITAYLIWLLFL